MDEDEWEKETNRMLEERGSSRRVMHLGSNQQPKYTKGLVWSLIWFSGVCIIAIIVLLGTFVYKYHSTELNQTVSVNPSFNPTTNTQNTFSLEANATFIIKNLQVNCYIGGCNNSNSS